MKTGIKRETDREMKMEMKMKRKRGSSEEGE